MTLTRSKWTLAGVWLAGAGLVFVVLVGQSLAGRYGEHSNDAWSWYLPTVMPTLSLIIGALVGDFRSEGPDPGRKKLPDNARGLLWLGLALSVFYLGLVSVAVLAQPFLPQLSPLDLMQRSNLWLGPLQGLTVGVLAAFFRKG